MTSKEITKDNFRIFFLYVIIISLFVFSIQRDAGGKSDADFTLLFLFSPCEDVDPTSSQVKNKPAKRLDNNTTSHRQESFHSIDISGINGMPEMSPKTNELVSNEISDSIPLTTGSFPASLISCRFDHKQSLTDHIPYKELVVIEKAAQRNACFGEDLLILLAIRKAENGSQGREFGIMHPNAIDTDLDTQAGWAAATIVKNRKRWEREVITALPGGGNRNNADASGAEFIEYLGRRYCPPKAHPLNVHWEKNVKHWYGRFKRFATEDTEPAERKYITMKNLK